MIAEVTDLAQVSSEQLGNLDILYALSESLDQLENAW